ncbi:phospholipase D-like domain-containing protein [Pseudolabrys sp.]|uniref:phospholipase D-like domain-containing protein n=1 Tax=Pseudolabrys sp. TaxID=1960880 RepID=UPI003D10C96A
MSEANSILRPGRNCWRVARAGRARVLVDADNYFRSLDASLEKARRSVLIMGWDFDASIRLRGDDPNCPTLGDRLRALVEERPELEVRILIWSVAAFHAPGAPLPLLLGSPWERHPRIQVRLDSKHPFYASHHAKVVCVDDSIAFVGGMDLTVLRWDTCEHPVESPFRVSQRDGSSYGPVHDVQMAVDGEAARAVGDYVRDRWTYVIGETVTPATGQAWPDGLAADFSDVDVAISRTLGPYGGRPGVFEAVTLLHDALRAARRLIYIEAQYVTSVYISRILERHLRHEDGPEIVMVVRKEFNTRMEAMVMGHAQDRLINRLHRADRFGRFRAFSRAVGASDARTECAVNVHSKVIVVDDVFLRVGSSNLNNRSLGLDSECDLAIEAHSDAHRAAVAGVRDGLIAEHTGQTPQTIAQRYRDEGSMRAAIAALNCNDSCLRPLKRRRVSAGFGVLTALFDPLRPLDPIGFLLGRRAGWRSGDSRRDA